MNEIRTSVLTRVEGHGTIEVEHDGKNALKAQVNIIEGPRLIEQILHGRTIDEMLSIVVRICAICSVSHKYAALRAVEGALDVKVPEKVHLLRTLLHYGEMIESHSLHLFLLALPDLLGYSSAVGMLDKHRDLVLNGLRIKAFGNKIMQTVNARYIHGENATVGRFGRYPENSELEPLRREAEELIPIADHCIRLLGKLHPPSYYERETQFLCLEPTGGQFGYVGDGIIVSNGTKFAVSEAFDHIKERTVGHSYAKRSTYKGRSFMVGALARINLLGERLTGLAGRAYRQNYTPKWLKNPLYNNHAQAIEMLFCLENVSTLIDEIVRLPNPPEPEITNKSGDHIGAVEAPRGLLLHHHVIEDGIVIKSNIVTPTAQNLDNIEYYLKATTENLLQTDEPPSTLADKLEILVRAYDPCISCSVHVVTNVVEQSS